MLVAVAFYKDPLVLMVAGLVLLCLFFWYFATDFERRKRNIGSVLMLLVCSLCLLSIFPVKDRLKGGIDIVGGSSFLLRVQPSENGPVTIQQTEQAMKVVEDRLNGMGTTEPLIARRGVDSILVQMPGIDENTSKQVRTTLEKVAKLELHEVHPQSEMLVARIDSGEELAPPGFAVYDSVKEGRILLNKRVALGGKQVKDARPSDQQNDAVSITLNGEGGDRMIALTKNKTPGQDRIAIVLDNKVLSAPVLKTVPLGSIFTVEGLHEPGEVRNLANALMNPLENPLKVDASSTVSPTLGAAVVTQGITAGIVGLAVTFLFVLLYYRVAGFVALIGLIINTVILFGLMAMFGFTFSLPGIAGMILTIGMAVDANVLIYERLREEMEAGKSLTSALATAYNKAFSAIIDANAVSLISAVVLLWLGSSSVKGFAITLIIGIVASLFSAILVTRVMFRWGTDLNVLKKLSFLNLIKSHNFDFLGKRGVCGIVSLALFLMTIGAFVWKKERALSVDFNGGTLIQFQLGKNATVTQAEADASIAALRGSQQLKTEAFPQIESNPITGSLLTVRCDTDDANAIESGMRTNLPALSGVSASREEVSALIGGDAIRSSLLALGLGFVGIMIYVTLRYDFSFALGALVALLHDVIISLGFVVLSGSELSTIHVGAILTIAGFSINDTVVVFDRIRETMANGTGKLQDVMNEAINATLSRTILTSVTTIGTVAILSFFGGSTLRDFSVMILAGLIVGTYSSIFVASPVVLWWHNLGRYKASATSTSTAVTTK